MSGDAAARGAADSGARRPVIGISAYCEQASWGLWNLPAVVLPQNYVDQVVGAGGIPVLLPPLPAVDDVVHRLDGLIISGGPDVEPVHYGEEPGPNTTVVRPDRDAAELALFRRAIAAEIPVLGICRGMQLMNVALGGSLIQHLPDLVGHDGHSPTPGQMGTHEVKVAGSGRLAGILGQPSVVVPTHHHQGVGQLGAGLIATAWADDGTVEAIELEQPEAPGHPFTVAVQWHPEAGHDPSLFRALITAAAAVAHARLAAGAQGGRSVS
ncbi:MAG TPA: gamma-glutamyl-gamma-aminobutyrate hydrolase family protein [Streptosporangiaceae bacterium]|nr:gamma-glutamyl-gamma-aminobutyrate hydrolase family protein [Streptosporangiaceae bacterium]